VRLTVKVKSEAGDTGKGRRLAAPVGDFPRKGEGGTRRRKGTKKSMVRTVACADEVRKKAKKTTNTDSKKKLATQKKKGGPGFETRN